MIQKTSQRQLNAVLANARPPAVGEPEEWGQWIRNKHYSLEVTQHPLRARMCGFGDKDRRPLAPAAVAKMIVRRADHSILDVDDIDVDFFVVTVDLWSADGTEEMNLVQHPSADRFVPAYVVKPRKRGPSGSGPPSTPLRPSRPSPYPTSHERPRSHTNHPPVPGPGPGFALRPIESSPTGSTPLLTPASTPSYNSSGYPFPTTDPFSGAVDATNPWSYPPALDRTPFQAPTLPSIRSIGRNSPAPGTLPADINTVAFPASDEPDLTTPFRAWNDVATGLFESHNVDPVLRDTGGAPRWTADAMMIPSIPAGEVWPSAAQHAFQPFGQTLVHPQNPPQPQPHPQSQQQQQQQEDQQHKQHHQEEQQSSRDGLHTISSLPRPPYTRTLVGPLSANAQRLQDEHRKPGIFFLFQDLSIRTEGTFRLRMRLMNVGIPPAPNGLSNSVHTGVSPVLAQIFTEPFTVYSAKRFPGVPSTTALSIAFGNQGQKLPLRNRHKQQPRSRRSGPASSDDESS